jgi:hypothetical protein
MNAILYFGINIIAVIVLLIWVIMGNIAFKVVGIIGLIYIIKEFATGKYKKYIQ